MRSTLRAVGANWTCPPFFAFFGRALFLIPLSFWRILAYVFFLAGKFGEPLAFIQTQQHWQSRPSLSGMNKIMTLLSLEPLWSVFDPSSTAYWARSDPALDPFFSLAFANPLYFLGAAVLIFVGARRGWLSSNEILFAAFLLGIPYFTRGYEMAMASSGRFASVVFPIYLVLGNLLARLPRPLAAGLLTLAGFYLLLYSALFASWHRVF